MSDKEIALNAQVQKKGVTDPQKNHSITLYPNPPYNGKHATNSYRFMSKPHYCLKNTRIINHRWVDPSAPQELQEG